MRCHLWALFFVAGSFAQSASARDCSFSGRDKADKSLLYRTASGAALLAVWQASELVKGQLPATPRWTDEDLNGYDQLGEKLRWSPGGLDESAALMSDAFLGLTIVGPPALAFLGESKDVCLYEDLLVFEETLGVAILLNQSAKFLARRERPFARDLSDEDRGEICLSDRECVDLNLSFYSGHATFTFAAAVAAGTIAKNRGYLSAPAAYSFGLVGAGLTAYLRVAAGKHYLSDVTLGAVSGVAIGYLFPTYIHPPKQGRERSLNVKLLPSLNQNPGVQVLGAF